MFGALEEGETKAEFESPHAAHGIAVQYAFEHEGVVGVDPVGNLGFRGGEQIWAVFRTDGGKQVQKFVQAGGVLLEGGVADAAVAGDKLLQHSGVGAGIEAVVLRGQLRHGGPQQGSHQEQAEGELGAGEFPLDKLASRCHLYELFRLL